MGKEEEKVVPLREVPSVDLALAIAGVGIASHKALRQASIAFSSIAVHLPDGQQKGLVIGAASTIIESNKELAEKISKLLELLDPEGKSNGG